jgi:glycine/serine hydroxymethyltransferase
MIEVARLISQVLANIGSDDVIRDVRQRVAALTARFPLYAHRQQLAAIG